MQQRLYFRADSLALSWLESYGLARPAADGKVPASDYPALAERLVTRMENDGYPFAAVSLSPLTEPASTVKDETTPLESGSVSGDSDTAAKG